MSENETIADIVAQIRAVAHIQTADTPRSVMQFADRIEAAAKREEAIHAMTCEANERLREHLEIALKNNKRPVGNAAALREALEKCRDLAEMLWLSGTGEDMSSEVAELKDTINAALSAPPRNCDVGTAEEQDARFVKWRYSNPLRAELGLDALAWAQMPYEPDTKKEERNDAK